MGNRKTRQALAAALVAGIAVPAAAGSFSLDGGVEGQWTLGASVGSSWRARSADLDLVSVGNGGTASDGNDDGSLNYPKGRPFSTIVKVVGDVQLKRDNLGLFVRAKAWYDHVAEKKGVPHGSFTNGYVPGARLVDDFDDKLSRFSGAALADAYVFGDFKLGDKPVSVRFGNQVVNWGESLFVPGINQYGSFDIPAAHRPGAQVKEILLPVPQLWASAGLGGGVTLEAFYQFKSRKTVLDGCGTYWSPADGINCPGLLVSPVPVPDAMAFAGIPPFFGLNARMDRLPDRDSKDSGQYGAALRYFAEPIATEFGAYYVNYHQRFPSLGVSKTPSGPASIWQAGVAAPAGSQYFWDYSGENIKVAGLSASTVIGGWAVFGEASHTRGLPVALNGADVVLGTLAGFGPLPELFAVPAGGMIVAADRKNKNQFQVGTLKIIPRVLGADGLTVLGEVAWQSWSGIGDPMTSRRYGRGFSFGQAETATLPCAFTGNPNPSFCEAKGFATRNAWGFRMFGELSYPDVIAGANVKPRVFYSKDVKGYSADGTFLEGRSTLSAGVRFDYRERYYLDLSATTYNHKAKYDTQRDRDFYALVLGVNF
ncbi:MAG TPA: DUF1302 domain-containing protein [Ramlibacter sp.]|nr:DUF1302 domain-containing protein [Ramlibacter sp.]